MLSPKSTLGMCWEMLQDTVVEHSLDNSNRETRFLDKGNSSRTLLQHLFFGIGKDPSWKAILWGTSSLGNTLAGHAWRHNWERLAEKTILGLCDRFFQLSCLLFFLELEMFFAICFICFFSFLCQFVGPKTMEQTHRWSFSQWHSQETSAKVEKSKRNEKNEKMKEIQMNKACLKYFWVPTL